MIRNGLGIKGKWKESQEASKYERCMIGARK